MMNLRIILSLVCVLSLFSCSKDETKKEAAAEYMVFGKFNGFCEGEQCIEIFKIDSTSVYEDRSDKYPERTLVYEGDFDALNSQKFEIAKSLKLDFPMDLLKEDKIVFGCPDCADQGGVYLEWKFGGQHKFWLFDNNKSNVPEYLHDYMDAIHEKILLLQ